VSAKPCDFCNGADAAHALPCDPVAVRATGPHGTAQGTLVGDWNACGACLPFIERADPDGLADHVARAGHGPPAILKLTTAAFRRDVFCQLYRRVIPLLGPAVPLGRACARCHEVGRSLFETEEGDRCGRCVRFVGRRNAPPWREAAEPKPGWPEPRARGGGTNRSQPGATDG